MTEEQRAGEKRKREASHPPTGDGRLPLYGLKKMCKEPVALGKHACKREYNKRSLFSVEENEHTGQRWLIDASNSGKLLGVIEHESVEEQTGADGKPENVYKFTFRKPRRTDHDEQWSRERVERSAYFQALRMPAIANSQKQRMLSENAEQRRVYVYPHCGVERVVARRITRAQGGSAHLQSGVSHCSALVFTGRDPFGATVAVVVEGAHAVRTVRVPCTWPEDRPAVEQRAALLADLLERRVQEKAKSRYDAKRQLGDLYEEDSAGGDAEDGGAQKHAPRIMLNWRLVYGTGIDMLGYRGSSVADAGLSFVEFYFSHTFYARLAERILIGEDIQSWLPASLLPDASQERGEYIAPHWKHAFRVYDAVDALQTYMYEKGRRWGAWFRLSVDDCSDFSAAKTAEEGRLTLCDREYRCGPDAFLACSEGDRCHVDGQWRKMDELMPDLLVATFDGEMRPPENKAFPKAHRDSLFQLSLHTHTVVSKRGAKYLFGYGSIVSDAEFQRELSQIEEDIERSRAAAHVSQEALNTVRVKREMQERDQEMLDMLQELATRLEEDASSDERLEGEANALVDASSLKEFDEYFSEEERDEIKSYIMRDKETAMDNTDAVIGEQFVFDREVDMLKNFCEFIQVLQPDLITGWNMIFDATWLLDRSLVLGSTCAEKLGLVPGVEVRTRTTVARSATRGVFQISGMVPMDMLFMVMEQKKYDSYSLNYVADILIGRQKATMPYEMIHRLSSTPSGRRMIAIYCSEDSNLVVQISRKLRPFLNYVQRCRVTNNQFSTLVNYGAETVSYSAHISEMKIAGPKKFVDGGGFYCPLLPRVQKQKYQGGTVFKPRSGYYEDETHLVVDLNSLYPSTQRNKNLCTTTVINQYHAARLGIGQREEDLIRRPIFDFDQDAMDITYRDNVPNELCFVSHDIFTGILPNYQGDLYNLRLSFKATLAKAVRAKVAAEEAYERNRCEETLRALEAARFEVERLDSIQLQCKLQMNSIYGVIASPTYKFSFLIISESITAFSRECIVVTAIFQERTMLVANGYPFDLCVTYGDTDSTMCMARYEKFIVDYDLETGEPIFGAVSLRAKHSVAVALGRPVATAINEYYKRPSAMRGIGSKRSGPIEKGGGYQHGAIELKYEKNFLYYNILSAKCYSGVFDDNIEAYLAIKGLGAVRRDVVVTFRKHQKNIIYLLSVGEPQRAVECARDFLKELHQGLVPMQDLVCTLKLSKPIEEYASETVATRAARRLKKFTGALPAVGARFAAVSVLPPKVPGKKYKVNETFLPLEEALATNAQCNAPYYKEAFLKLMRPLMSHLYEGGVEAMRKDLCADEVFTMTSKNILDAHSDRLDALAESSKRDERAMSVYKQAVGGSIARYFTKRASVRCVGCKQSVNLSDLSPQMAKHYRKNSSLKYYCAACKTKGIALADMEDLCREVDALRKTDMTAYKKCVKCQEDMNIQGVNVINAMIATCEAITCHNYVRRKVVAMKKRRLTRKLKSFPEDLRTTISAR